MYFISLSEKETTEFAQSLAKGFTGGEIVTLDGRLGAGKTIFAKGIAKGLLIDDVVVSPTFTLMQVYEGRLRLYHCDMYRIDSEQELYETDFFDALNDKNGVCVIEWSSNIKNFLPKKLIKICIDMLDEKTREITVEHL